jgi:hypothetical protein
VQLFSPGDPVAPALPLSVRIPAKKVNTKKAEESIRTIFFFMN